jgi:hypothetical protein
MGGSDVGGRVGGGVIVLLEGDGLGFAEAITVTRSVAEPVNDKAFFPVALAVSWTCSPSVALAPTLTPTCSS